MVHCQMLKIIKESEKSRIYLVFHEDTQTVLVEKHLYGRQELYQKLMELHHPYLPRLYDVQLLENETIVWEEYISGRPLAQIKVNEEQLSKWFLELCDVIGFLHQHQIIHRDIKPSNLLLGQDGHIRLIDFDAAREPKEEADSDTRLLGTKGFAPPEQYGFAQTDQRADLYALGITWKALLGTKAEQKPYKTILRKCTDLNPEKRYSSAKALAFAWKTRKIRQYFPGIIACMLLLVSTLGWYWYQQLQPEISRKNYPEEELLFYTWDSNHIIAQVGDLIEHGEIQSLSIDLDGDGKKETLELKKNVGGDSPEIVLTSNTPSEKPLFSGEIFSWLKYCVPIGTYMGQGEGDDQYYWWEPDPKDYFQITCKDLDPLTEDNGMEILISVGNGSTHTVTMVCTYDETQEFPLTYRGFMWGSTAARQTESGAFEVGLMQNLYTDYNLYYYAFQELSPANCLDFNEYWSWFSPA